MNVLPGLILVALVSAVFAGCGPSCPEEYLNWENDCYKLCNVQKTWVQAEQHCVADGAHLASVHSAAEDNFLNLLSQKGTTPNKETWIGLNDKASEGIFGWTDESPVDYRNWHAREPNNAGAGEQCTEINYFKVDGTWNDHFCSRQHRFICKMPTSYQ